MPRRNVTFTLLLFLSFVLATSLSATDEDLRSKDTATAAQVDTTESQATPSGTGKEQLATQLAAYYALERWKNAWQAADVKKYLASYSSNFSPANALDLATWKKKRRASLTRPKFIHVTIKNPVVQLMTDNHLLITFTQSYQSDAYQDTSLKILTMVKEKGGWKISEERDIQEPFR